MLKVRINVHIQFLVMVLIYKINVVVQHGANVYIF